MFKKLKIKLRYAWNMGKLLAENTSGKVGGGIVAIFISAILAAYLLPSALLAIDNATTTDWNTNTVAVWGVMGVIVVVAVLFIFINKIRG